MIRKPVLLLLAMAQVALPRVAQAQDCKPGDTVGWIYVSFTGCTPAPGQRPIKLPELPPSGSSKQPEANHKDVGGTSYWVYELDPDRRVDNLRLSKVLDLQGFRVKGPATGKATRIGGSCVGHFRFDCERAWTAVISAKHGANYVTASVRYKDNIDGRQEAQQTRFRVEGLHLDAILELDVRSGKRSICQRTFNSDDLSEPQTVDLSDCLNELLLNESKEKGSSPPNPSALAVILGKLQFLHIKKEQ